MAQVRNFIAKQGVFIVIYSYGSGRTARFITGSGMDKEKLEFLQTKAVEIRKIAIEMIGRLGSGHVGGSLSIIDPLTDI